MAPQMQEEIALQNCEARVPAEVFVVVQEGKMEHWLI